MQYDQYLMTIVVSYFTQIKIYLLLIKLYHHANLNNLYHKLILRRRIETLLPKKFIKIHVVLHEVYD